MSRVKPRMVKSTPISSVRGNCMLAGSDASNAFTPQSRSQVRVRRRQPPGRCSRSEAGESHARAGLRALRASRFHGDGPTHAATAIAVKPGFRRSIQKPKRKSASRFSIWHLPRNGPTGYSFRGAWRTYVIVSSPSTMPRLRNFLPLFCMTRVEAAFGASARAKMISSPTLRNA